MYKTKGAIFKCYLLVPFICLNLFTTYPFFCKSGKTVSTQTLPYNSDFSLLSDSELMFLSLLFCFKLHCFLFLQIDKKIFLLLRISLRDLSSSVHHHSNSLWCINMAIFVASCSFCYGTWLQNHSFKGPLPKEGHLSCSPHIA